MTKAGFKTFCDGLALYASRFIRDEEIKGFYSKGSPYYSAAIALLFKGAGLVTESEEKPSCKLIPFTPALYRKTERKRMVREFYEQNH